MIEKTVERKEVEISTEKKRLAMKFLWNLHFKDFKETGHTKWTVKFWQESEKKKNSLKMGNLNKNVLFYCVFLK